ncbi:ABC transporter substrate-binding protein [Acidiphilium sp. PA]|uniref:ABC transporter substrate-binding protein n=1 Tax=Acidiphilium sp. PA TaxID=2871705 RepID=UPI0022435AC9|nr:ABC transporter substrate-binding protein [Acidiphilium sp. PA]MCW8308193.1 ABC transporter substrate-binding protein [Acidiphilium sp. PA]
MTKQYDEFEQARRAANDMQNHVIDEFIAGRIDRRGLLRHGTAYGLSAALIGGALGAPRRARAAGKPDATIRVAITAPSTAINPVTAGDTGSLCMLQQTGEFLLFDTPDLHLQPALATAWSANPAGTVWTFKLRRGVKFHSGGTMTADDVVYSLARLADPKNGSNALSTFKGVLSPSGIVKQDDYTVVFHLDAPNGNFPYLVSSDNYNAIILPKGSDAATFEKTFDGTGPFKFDSYTPGRGASFVRNPDYWGKPALPARTEFGFYANQQSQILALQGGQVDLLQQIVVQGAQGLLNDPSVKIIKLRSSNHREVHMRCDMAPFTDKRVRQAVALTLNRPGIVQGLFRGLSDLGNDSPFAPVYPSTNKSVPQRAMNIAKAKHLLAAAGVKPGTQITLTTEQVQEIPDYAVLIQNAAAEIGLKINLKIETSSAYYGKATFGNSDWLDSQMGITDYGHRGVPNVFLTAPLESNGPWNAAHFKNKTYDSLVADYIATVDLQKQRVVSGKIERLLLDETPIIFAYFYDYLAASVPHMSGVQVSGLGQVFLQNATIA